MHLHCIGILRVVIAGLFNKPFNKQKSSAKSNKELQKCGWVTHDYTTLMPWPVVVDDSQHSSVQAPYLHIGSIQWNVCYAIWRLKWRQMSLISEFGISQWAKKHGIFQRSFGINKNIPGLGPQKKYSSRATSAAEKACLSRMTPNWRMRKWNTELELAYWRRFRSRNPFTIPLLACNRKCVPRLKLLQNSCIPHQLTSCYSFSQST